MGDLKASDVVFRAKCPACNETVAFYVDLCDFYGACACGMQGSAEIEWQEPDKDDDASTGG